MVGTDCVDTPERAISEKIKVKPNDIIVAGTDGLFDNLFESDILNFVKKTNDPIICAKAIADAAMRNAKDKTVYLKI